MKLKLPKDVMQNLVNEKGIVNPIVIRDYKDWRSEQEVDTEYLTAAEVDAIYVEVTKGEANLASVDCRRIARQIRNLRLLENDNAKISNLQTVADALKKKLMGVNKHWIYSDRDKEIPLPFFVENVRYCSATDRCPAHVQLDLENLHRGKKQNTSITIFRNHIKGESSTLMQICDAVGIRYNNEEFEAEYTAEYNRWVKVHQSVGEQFLVHGTYTTRSARDNSGYRDYTEVLFGLPEAPGRGVCDDDEDFEEASETSVSKCWKDKSKVKLEDEDSDDVAVKQALEGLYDIPVHFYVRMFDLKHHQFAEIHIRNIADYVYNEKMADELVLSEDRRDIIELLLGNEQKFVDVVAGKSQGLILLLTGLPGVGKTLTAEVYAERIKRPLYIVQCSQLGIDADSLEKELNIVLSRASKWRAVLLIDEADVYIRERGADINQNAIVGVFLRLLEYFNGVLFMTSNREDIVDDAILSRLSALVRYALPTEQEQLLLWNLFLTKNKIDYQTENMSRPACLEDLHELAAEFPHISGRSINKLVALAKSKATRAQKPVSLEMLKELARFQVIERVKKEKKELTE